MTNPTHSNPGVIDIQGGAILTAEQAKEWAERVIASGPAGHVPMSAPTHGFTVDEVRDFPFPSEPEVKSCELTYAGKVDMPAGTQLGPGIDMRVATVQGCSYDAATNKSTVFVEAVTPLPLVQDETAVHHFAQVVATSYNQHVAGASV